MCSSPSTSSFCNKNNSNRSAQTLAPALMERDMNVQDKSGKSLLIHCCARGLTASVEELCADQNIDVIDVNLEDVEGNTALIHAAQSGHTQILELLIQRFPGIEIDHVNKLGQTALIKAAIQGRVNCAKLLLKAGADVNKRDNGRQFTAMKWAEFVGRVECAKVLAEFVDPCRKLKKNALPSAQGNLKQVACVAAIPLIGNSDCCHGIGEIQHVVRPRIRSAPPKCCVRIRITPPSSPQFNSQSDWQQYWERILMPKSLDRQNNVDELPQMGRRPKSSAR